MHVGLEDGGVIGGGLHKLGAFYAERCVADSCWTCTVRARPLLLAWIHPPKVVYTSIAI